MSWCETRVVRTAVGQVHVCILYHFVQNYHERFHPLRAEIAAPRRSAPRL